MYNANWSYFTTNVKIENCNVSLPYKMYKSIFMGYICKTDDL